MLRSKTLLTSLAALSILAWALPLTAVPVVVCRQEATPQEKLAAKELVRYVYLRTGQLPELASALAADRDGILLAIDKSLGLESFAISTTRHEQCVRWTVRGGSPLGLLYGAYRFAEGLGIRFYLHGDVVPDQRLSELPAINVSGKPLFETRGIQPFHDFPEGPDWWNEDDYLACISQLAKMRMNFIGLHCYPEGAGPEPAVWIGLADDCDRQGRVAFSYPSWWANTMRPGAWGYAACGTSRFCAGAAKLFASDAYGPDVIEGLMPKPQTPEQCNALFERTAGMFHTVFAHARALGVKTCIGTETPLNIPGALREHLRRKGMDPNDISVVRKLYAGMFRRIAAAYPVDYYWLWIPENWTWSGNKPEEYEATARDIRAALEALDALGRPFTLATCGWVLGPQQDRAALDKMLPRDVPMSCISRQVGHAPVEPAFANISARPKWAIPWMENDPSLTAPQPWAARMRYDAADALRLGCTGLLGIHWRTKAMAGNVSALALAAWEQPWADSGSAAAGTARPGHRLPPGPIRGTCARFDAPVAGTAEPAIYQTVRYDVDGYEIEVPNGAYTVTLKFNEPHYAEAGKRVFGAMLQGKQVIEHLDIFAKAGRNRALDYTFSGVAVSDGRLHVEFTPETEFPCIAGIVVRGTNCTRKINCGGPAVGGYESDEAPGSKSGKGRDRAMPIEDFYVDFARTSFGANVAEDAGKLLARIDGASLPEPATWIDGPGGIKPENAPWAKLKSSYAFVDALAAIRGHVRGPGNLERFDYWLNTYRAMAAMAELACARGELDVAIVNLKQTAETAQKRRLVKEALATRMRMARLWEKMLSFQIAATDTPGELGTITNFEQHSRMQLKFLALYDKELEQSLGSPLPKDAEPGQAYAGPGRLIVPTVRSTVDCGESLKLRAIAMGQSHFSRVELCWRTMGRGSFAVLPMQNIGRSVYSASLPPAKEDIEYYIAAVTSGGEKLSWPATAPAICQTVIVWPNSSPAR